MTVMITGHRQIVPLNHGGSPWPEYSASVRNHHENVIQVFVGLCWFLKNQHNHKEFISGMAIGADQLFAKAILKLQDVDPEVVLHTAIPFKGQESKWPLQSQTEYNSILNKMRGSKNIVCDDGYASWKMQKRNEWMVDRSEVVIALFNRKKQKGGTHNCVSYALNKGRHLIYVDPTTLIITET